MTDERKRQAREASKRYRASDKGQAALEAYARSEEGRARRNAASRRWREKKKAASVTFRDHAAIAYTQPMRMI